MRVNFATEWAAKLLMLLAWPMLTALLCLMVLGVCASAWLLIPFGQIKRTGKGYSMTFPWSDK